MALNKSAKGRMTTLLPTKKDSSGATAFTQSKKADLVIVNCCCHAEGITLPGGGC
jgi:hypothetical protein